MSDVTPAGLGQAIAAVRERFGIAERPVNRLDQAGLALNVGGRAAVPRWGVYPHPDSVPWLEFGCHGGLFLVTLRQAQGEREGHMCPYYANRSC